MNRLRNQPSTNKPELRYIEKGLEKLVPAIEELKMKLARGESVAGAKYWGIPFIVVDSERLALLTLSSIYNMSGHTGNGIYQDIANRVLLQVAYETLKHEEKGVVSWIDDHNREGVRSRNLSIIRNRADKYMETRWTKRESQIVGATLANTALNVCEEIEQCKVYTSRGRWANGIQIRKEVRDDIENTHSDIAVLTPAYLPMVSEPNDWTDFWNGGYYLGNDSFSCTAPIIKESLSNHLKRTDVSTLGLHLDAVNYLQKTRWTSNMYIADLCRTIDINQSAVGKKLGLLPLDPPDKDKVNWDDPHEKDDYYIKARSIHDRNRKTKGKRTLFYQLGKIAYRYEKKYDKYYFAWQLDFRGRFYPRFCGMDPQGDKLNKSYLKFREGKPLGDTGYEALTVHLANGLGLDKLSIPDRIQGVKDQEPIIRAYVKDPISHIEWIEEDGPYLLAAAEEWVRATDSQNREEFLAHIPCAIDGKCNGLQHLSALARDPAGAFATCLIPHDTPQDIYMAVKHKVDEYISTTIREANLDQVSNVLPEKIEPGELKKLSVKEREMRKRQQNFYAALNWRGKTTRKLVKRGAMTWAYGVTKQGIMEQLIADGLLDSIDGNVSVNASYMRDAIYWAVNNVVESARDVMEWLQEVAAIAFDEEKALRWTNPAGMLITQEYLRQDYKELSTVTGRFRCSLLSDDREMIRGKQINGVAPNFVHSIDAAHMANVVLRLKDLGIVDMHMVHDSYAVHPNHVQTLHQVVREEFVKIHERNLLQEFKDEVEQDLGIVLPDYPKQGDFDVRRVLDSTYAFA